MQPIKLQVNGNPLIFTGQSLTFAGREFLYSKMSDIAHRGGENPAFVFTYEEKRLAMPYNPKDKDTIMRLFQQVIAMNRKREEQAAKEEPIEEPITPVADFNFFESGEISEPQKSDYSQKYEKVIRERNMKSCDSCGEEIPKSAPNCPFCGAKNKKPVHKRGWFIVLCIFVALCILSALIEVDTDAPADTGEATTESVKETTEAVLNISPGDLLDKYEENEVKGDEIYDDKKNAAFRKNQRHRKRYIRRCLYYLRRK